MSKVFNIFTEKNGEFSWRKIMTAGALLCFMTATFGYMIKNDFDELPSSYQGIIAGVFAFYFMKSIFTLGKYNIIENSTDDKNPSEKNRK